LLTQRKLFNAHKKEIKKKHPQEVVGFCGGQMFVGSSIHEVLEKARQALPKKVTYLQEPGTF